MAPVAPVAPVGPAGPVAPVAPVAPAGPVAPVAPVRPVAPVGPAGPCAPVGPVGPVGAVGKGKRLPLAGNTQASPLQACAGSEKTYPPRTVWMQPSPPPSPIFLRRLEIVLATTFIVFSLSQPHTARNNSSFEKTVPALQARKKSKLNSILVSAMLFPA